MQFPFPQYKVRNENHTSKNEHVTIPAHKKTTLASLSNSHYNSKGYFAWEQKKNKKIGSNIKLRMVTKTSVNVRNRIRNQCQYSIFYSRRVRQKLTPVDLRDSIVKT